MINTFTNKILLFLAFLLPFSIYPEYTVGLRGNFGMNLIVGKVGSTLFTGTPPLLPFITSKQNTYSGGELFGELLISKELYIEPSLGYLKQRKRIVAPGLLTNINGVITVSNDIWVFHELENLSFGIMLKGKTSNLKRRFRFSASFGFQFLYALNQKLGYHLKSARIKAPATREDKAFNEKYDQDLAEANVSSGIPLRGDLNPWGLRMLGGMGLDFYHPRLQNVVLQFEIKGGFDLSNWIFQNDELEQITIKNNIPERLRKTYFEFVGGLYIGAAYRIPVGKAAIKSKGPEKRSEISVDED